MWPEAGIAPGRDKPLVFVLDDALTTMPLPFDGLRHVTGESEYARFVRELAESAAPVISDFPPGSVEEAARDKLYYCPGGWVRAVRLWGAEDAYFTEDRVRIEYQHVPLEIPAPLAEAGNRTIENKKKHAEAIGEETS